MGMATYTYTADNGVTTTVVLDEFYGEQAAFGWTNASESTINKPLGNGFKPRMALCIDATGYKRRIPCGTIEAPAYVNAATSVNLRKRGSTDPVAAKTYGHEGERLINRTALAGTFA